MYIIGTEDRSSVPWDRITFVIMLEKVVISVRVVSHNISKRLCICKRKYSVGMTYTLVSEAECVVLLCIHEQCDHVVEWFIHEQYDRLVFLVDTGTI